MDTIATLFEPGRRRSAVAQQRLLDAYQAVFSGRGEPQDAEIVLTDLARTSGYFEITTPAASSEQLWFNEGGRLVMGRVLQYTCLPGQAQQRLAEAVRAEHAASSEEGQEL